MDGSIMSSKGGLEMENLVEESIGSRDMLESQTNQAFEFEHVEVKDPEHEKVDEEVKKTIEEIPSKFGQTAEKKKPAAAKTAAATKARPTTATKRTAPAPAKAAGPNQKDLQNSKRAASRAKAEIAK